ncbi:peptidoglycan-associated lipoprotein Pal [Sandarakinorhabdus sp.]|uniref:peptidoglycan-associated lipoprotein Pal n=1 Tax=Sandarakinorhabdus sp. TaxID=1916663 RepID=UPI00333ECF4C
MHRSTLRLILLAGVGMVLAACQPKKPPATLAPPPATARPEPAAPTPAPEPVAKVEMPAATNSAVPGSQEDLRAQAGGDTVLFDYDSYELSAEARGVLAQHAQWLKTNPAVRVTLAGHCDERGTREYNLALGDRRANSVKNFLAGQGIDVSRLSTISYGKERPAAEGTDEAAMAGNRRAVTMVAG